MVRVPPVRALDVQSNWKYHRDPSPHRGKEERKKKRDRKKKQTTRTARVLYTRYMHDTFGRPLDRNLTSCVSWATGFAISREERSFPGICDLYLMYPYCITTGEDSESERVSERERCAQKLRQGDRRGSKGSVREGEE